MCDAGAGMSWEMLGDYTLRVPHQLQPLLYTGHCSSAVLDPELFGNSIGGLGPAGRGDSSDAATSQYQHIHLSTDLHICLSDYYFTLKLFT